MRLISFALTTDQIRRREKTVTRRLGWRNLTPGTLLMACEKVMGRHGAPLVRLGVIVVTDVRREPLNQLTANLDYGFEETVREGFCEPDRSYWPSEFVRMFCDHMDCEPADDVTRIEFRYVPGGM